MVGTDAPVAQGWQFLFRRRLRFAVCVFAAGFKHVLKNDKLGTTAGCQKCPQYRVTDTWQCTITAATMSSVEAWLIQVMAAAIASTKAWVVLGLCLANSWRT